MASTSSSSDLIITNENLKRANSNFSFTEKLAELARNQDWVDGYKALKDSSVERNDYTFLWEAVSSGTEDTGNELYVAIRNYIDNIGNIDVCDLSALSNYAKILNVTDDNIDINYEFPKEIKDLIEIFSVNRAYLYNKSAVSSDATLRGIFGKWSDVPTRISGYSYDSGDNQKPQNGDYIYVLNSSSDALNYKVNVSELHVGKVLGKDVVVGTDNTVLFEKGTTLTLKDIRVLKSNNITDIYVKRIGTWKFTFNGTWNSANLNSNKNKWIATSEISRKVLTVEEVREKELENKTQSYLYALENTILSYNTVEQLIDSLSDLDKYKKLVRTTFYNTILKFLNLTVGEYSKTYSEINASDKIWKLNISRLTEKLWEDDVESDTDIYTLKNNLGVAKSFTEKIYVDDIIADRRKITDFDENQQTVIKAELEARQTRYSKDTSMKYYFMRLYKVIEFFRFTTIAFRNSYNLEDYDLSTSKYIITDKTSDSDLVLKVIDGNYTIDTNIVMRVAEWLSDYSFEICNTRNRMKMKCQKNMMTGTKKLLIDTIREYLLEKIDSETWKNFKSTTLFAANLNKNFDVSLVEYIDPTEYFNIYNTLDTVDKNENNLNSRYWENGYDNNGIFTSEEIRNFYNKLTDAKNTFVKNEKSDEVSDEPNLYDFLSNIFEMGATTNSITDAGATTTQYIATSGATVEEQDSIDFDSKSEAVLRKFSGNENIGNVPYANIKNSFHPSYQIHPFLSAFEEYNSAYTGIMNLINSFSLDIADSRKKLSQRVDELGNTINFWLNWNEDLTGYSTNYEKGGNDNDAKFNQDSPFNFDALDEFLASDNYITTLLDKTNKYYIDESTDKFILNDDELDREVQRLKKFKSQISELSTKEIFRYGKDMYGNIYILYKNEGERKNRDTLGTMWVRIKNHPIAFPLFDLDQTQSSLSEISCLNNTDNSKLINLISNKQIKFEDDYGVHSKSTETSYVKTNGLTLSVLSYSTSGIVYNDDNGEMIPLEAPSSYAVYTETETNLKFVKEPSIAININKETGILEYNYYVDSLTNEVVTEGTPIFTNNNETSSCSASIKPLESESDDAFLVYFNKDKSCYFQLKQGSDFHFAEYTDEIDTSSTIYTYKITQNGVTNKRACSKHKMTIKKYISIDGNKITGTYDENGNITIDNIGIVNGINVQRDYDFLSLSSTGVKRSVNGGQIYEDVSNYNLEFKDNKLQSISGSILNNGVESDGYIVTVGGKNNFFYALPTYDTTENKDDYDNISYTQVLKTLDIYPLKKSDETRIFTFSNDNYIYDNESHPLSTTTVYYSTTDITFSEVSGENSSDSIRTFKPIGIDNYTFDPYTTITDVVTSLDKLNELCETEDFSGYTGDIQTVEIAGVTCYYRLQSNVVSGLIIDTPVKYSNLKAEIYKLHGSFELYSSTYDDTPITLSFYDNKSANNVLTYTSLYASENQEKFNDFLISYDQSRLLLNFCNGTDNNYQNSGVIVGSLNVSKEYGEADLISYLRDTIRNLEYIDATSCGQSFHVGDAANRKAIFSLFATFTQEDNTILNRKLNTIEFSLYEIEKSTIRTYKFKTNLTYPLYNFSNDGGTYYSCKVVATTERLYVAFTCEKPNETDVVSNTVNGIGLGNIGSATFKNINQYCGDSLITILSFDISELDNITLEDEETRYIMQNGALGYFPQYSGLVGKNLMFTNSQLSSDDRFPFYAQFEPLNTDEEAFSLIDLYTVQPVLSSQNYGDIKVSRFIDTYDESDAIRGFIFDENNNKVVYHVDLTYGNNKTVNGLTQIELDNNVYDISRYTEDEENNIHVFAQNIDYAPYTEALVCDGKCTTANRVYIPIWSGLEGHIRTDFKEIFDVSDRNFIIFHGDGYTVSNAILRTRSSEDVYFVGGVADLTNNEYVSDKSTSGYETNFSSSKSNNFSYHLNNELTYVDSDSNIINKTLDSNVSSIKTFFIKSNNIEYPCALYIDDKENILFHRFIGKNEYGDNDGSESTILVDATIKVEDFKCATSYTDVVTIGTTSYIIFGINSPKDTINIETYEHTKASIANSLFVINIDTTDINDWTISIELLEKSLDKIIRYTESEVVSTEVSNNDVLTLVSLNSDGKYGSIGWIDNNVAYSGSVAERSTIYDYNGNDEYAPSNVGKIYTIGSISICDADDYESVLISKDRGKTFYRSSTSKGSRKRIIGCTTTEFYAIAVDNGYMIYSSDGENWYKSLNIGTANWAVVTNGKISYALCNSFNENAVEVDDTHYVDIVSQQTIYGEKPYDYMFVDFDTSYIVMVGGIKANESLEIAVSTDCENFTHEILPHTNGIEYSSAYLFENNLFLSPKYSNHVVKISNLFDSSKENVVSYIDIADALSQDPNSYDGFEVINNSLIMYPSDGRRILVYNDGTESFVNYYTFKNTIEIADSDKVGKYPNNELIFTLYNATSPNSVQFYKTKFTGRNDYAIVEIDNGFPILVTYEQVKTNLGGVDVLVYEFTFKFLNAEKDTYVKIITTPDGVEDESYKAKFTENVLKSKSYIVGGKSIVYTFATVDSTTKYCIYKNYENKESESVDSCFNITYNLNTSRRNNNVFSYRLSSNTKGFVSIYNGFENFKGTDDQIKNLSTDFEYINVLSSTEVTTAALSGFKKYGFTDTAEFSGVYVDLKPSDNVDNYVTNSNFMFMSPATTFNTFEKMFKDCKNAEFTNKLYIDTRVATLKRQDTNKEQKYSDSELMNPSSAESMFEGCENASLPSANIGNSSIKNMKKMFCDCSNAILQGITIPISATDMDDAFKNCYLCTFETISALPKSLSSMSGAFYGCTKGTFNNFEFPILDNE